MLWPGANTSTHCPPFDSDHIESFDDVAPTVMTPFGVVEPPKCAGETVHASCEGEVLLILPADVTTVMPAPTARATALSIATLTPWDVERLRLATASWFVRPL